MSITYTCCPLPSATGCTYSQGYWKNHAEAWPVDSVLLGQRSYDKDELLSIFHTPVRGNGIISLSYQLIAAILNEENGASVPFEVDTAIGESHNIIDSQTVPPVDASTDWVSPNSTGSYTSILDDYNNGITGPGHCSE
jgi:hypothetical protein